MFNFGFTELMVLGVIALLVIGPKQLPQVARAFAKLVREFRNITSEVTSSLSDARHSIKSQVEDVKSQVPEAADFENRLMELINKKAEAADGAVAKNTEEESPKLEETSTKSSYEPQSGMDGHEMSADEDEEQQK